MVWGLGLRVQGSRFTVGGSRFKVQGSRFKGLRRFGLDWPWQRGEGGGAGRGGREGGQGGGGGGGGGGGKSGGLLGAPVLANRPLSDRGRPRGGTLEHMALSLGGGSGGGCLF